MSSMSPVDCCCIFNGPRADLGWAFTRLASSAMAVLGPLVGGGGMGDDDEEGWAVPPAEPSEFGFQEEEPAKTPPLFF